MTDIPTGLISLRASCLSCISNYHSLIKYNPEEGGSTPEVLQYRGRIGASPQLPPISQYQFDILEPIWIHIRYWADENRIKIRTDKGFSLTKFLFTWFELRGQEAIPNNHYKPTFSTTRKTFSVCISKERKIMIDNTKSHWTAPECTPLRSHR